MAPHHLGLARTLTLRHAVLYGLGITIGAGIYVLVGVAAGRSGMHVPLAFLIAAVVMGLTAATFAELSTRFPFSASEATYLDRAFSNRTLTLATGLVAMSVMAVASATISLGAAGYLGLFVPLPLPLLVAAIVLGMGLIAARAATFSVGLAGLMTLIEVGGLLVIVAGGLARPETYTRLPEMMPAAGDVTAWQGIALTALTAVFAFIGFEHIANIAEEIEDEQKNLPRALFITLALTAILYALVTWVAVVAVPPRELSASTAPLSLVFERLTGLSPRIMSAIALAATLNGIIVTLLVVARVLYGLAKQAHLPAWLTVVDPVSRAPRRATAIAVCVVLILALAMPLEQLAALTSTAALVLFALVNLALIRIKLRGDRVPVTAFIVPLWVPLLGLMANLALIAVDLVGWV